MVETAEEKGQDEFDEVEAMVGEPVKFNFFFLFNWACFGIERNLVHCYAFFSIFSVPTLRCNASFRIFAERVKECYLVSSEMKARLKS